MPPATFDETTVDIDADDYLFRVKGSVLKFAGWMAVYNQEASGRSHRGSWSRRRTAEDEEGIELCRRSPKAIAGAQGAEAGAEVHSAAAALQRGDAREGARRERHRPAEHVRVDHQRDPGARLREQDRRPVQADDARHDARRELLSPAFDDILDVEYTRDLEEELDKIEEGKEDYESTLSSFYKKFEKDLKRAAKEMVNLKEGVEPTRRSSATSAASRW